MSERITEKEISIAFKKIYKAPNLFQADDSAVVFFDIDFIESRIANLQRSFPPQTLHAIAVKANPLLSILEKIASMEVGAEVASLPELELARKAGFDPKAIVFDSPAKTIEEVNHALKLGCYLNADSIDELDRIHNLLAELDSPTESVIGIRINPQVGMGTIASTGVAGAYSKFGVPLNEMRDDLLDRFVRYPWLTGLHIHIGSQGADLDMLIDGVSVLYDFLTELSFKFCELDGNRKISHIDIGGGLPVTYGGKLNGLNLTEYVEILRTKFPEIFADKYSLVTEYGRYVHANSGWVVSKVEYVKDFEVVKTAMIHVGADMFLRKCYRPEDWHHDIFVLDGNGDLKNGTDEKPYNIAGPLCFAGDIIARDINLPEVNVGDFIVIRDTGAYTIGMWSRYNSRQMPKILGYRSHGNQVELLRDRETLEDIIKFWQ